MDFGLNMLATGRVEPTIRISVVTQPLNFPVLIGCELAFKLKCLLLSSIGFFVTSGDKFGGDFLAYPGDPLLFHAKFVVICHFPSKPPTFSSTSDHQKRRSEREQEALQVAR